MVLMVILIELCCGNLRLYDSFHEMLLWALLFYSASVSDLRLDSVSFLSGFSLFIFVKHIDQFLQCTTDICF
jgi:hypothetical protein